MSAEHVISQSDFRFESDMAEPVSRWLRRRRLTTKFEFSLPWGVCDLVAVKLNAQKTKCRLSYGQIHRIGSLFRVIVLSKIPDRETGRSIAITRLRDKLGANLPEATLLKEISRLTRAKFVVSPRAGFLQKLNGWAPLHEKVIAVELKLNRVSEAVSQAVVNRQFATHSYIALPMKLALRLSRSDRADRLTANGVGLLGVSSGACRELIRPGLEPISHDPIIQMHVVERFWAV
jgi:hypothetical protein